MASIKPTRAAAIIVWILTSLAMILSAWDRIFAVPSPVTAAVRLLLAALAAAAVVLTGFWLAGRSGLGTPVLSPPAVAGGLPAMPGSWFRSALACGLLVGGLGLLSMKTVFLAGNPAWRAAWAEEGTWPLWRRLALGYEAGVLEEILFRFVLLSLLVWAFSGFRNVTSVRPAIFWSANGLAALLFGLAHLAKPFALTPAEMAGILLVNGAGAAVFGYLFWKKGLESAVIAHMTADMVVRVIGHFLA